jgi:type IV secretion system protein VirB3
MAMGVPYVALLMIGFVTLELFLVTRNLLWVLVALPLYALCWLVCLAEPRFFDLLAVRGTVRLRAGLARHRRWRATSYGALPTVALRRREAPTSVVVESAECGS